MQDHHHSSLLSTRKQPRGPCGHILPFLYSYADMPKAKITGKETLEFLASTVLQYIPGELVKACKALAEIAGLAIRPDQTLDRQRAVAEVRHDLRGVAK